MTKIQNLKQKSSLGIKYSIFGFVSYFGFRASKFKKGFTLIELLVVMTMTAIIATITLTNYRAGEKQKRAALAADGITSALTLAQTYAQSGKATNNPNPACRVPEYYYVDFSYSSSYTLYGYDNCSLSSGTVDTIETYQLTGNTQIKAAGLVLDGSIVPVSSHLKIAIYPPFAQIKASAAAATYDVFNTATITVESTDSSASRSVTVDGVAGRIGD